MHQNIVPASPAGRRHTKQSGLIKTILLVVVAIFILHLLGFNIREWLDNPSIKEFFVSLWQTLKFVFQTFIIGPAVWLIDWIKSIS